MLDGPDRGVIFNHTERVRMCWNGARYTQLPHSDACWMNVNTSILFTGFSPYSMMLAPLTSYCHTACNHLLSTCPLLSVDLESVSRLLDGTINVLHKIYPLDTAAVAHKGKRLQCKSQRSTGELSHAQSRSSASALKSETGEEY